jgi:GT2 family glycosyltransferase
MRTDRAAAPAAGAYDADILILALDRVEDTLAAVASARAQQGARCHVIVLDQGSRAENAARLEAVLAGLPDVTFARAGENLGVPGGRNRAAALGRAPVLVGLDNDAEFAAPDCVARAIAALAGEADLAAIGFRIVRYDDGTDDLSSWGYPRALLPRAAEMFPACTFVGAGHAIRRAAWEEAGGYDARLFFTWEEYDLSLRFLALGWRVCYRGDIAVRHKVSAEARVRWSGRRWFQHVRNRLYIARKHGASWPGLAPRYLAYLARGLRHGLLRPTLAALPAAWRLARDAPRARLPAPARAYLARHDAAHRGPVLARLWRDVLSPLAGQW